MESLDLDGIFNRVIETLLHCHQLSTWNASKISDAQIVIIHKVGGSDALPWSAWQDQQKLLQEQQQKRPQQIQPNKQHSLQSDKIAMVRLERQEWIDLMTKREMMKQEKDEVLMEEAGSNNELNSPSSSNIHFNRGERVENEGKDKKENEEGHGNEAGEQSRNCKRKKKKGKQKKIKKTKANSLKAGNIVNIPQTSLQVNIPKMGDSTNSALVKFSGMSQGIQLLTDAEIKVELGAFHLPDVGNSLRAGNLLDAEHSQNLDSQQSVHDDGSIISGGMKQLNIIDQPDKTPISGPQSAVVGRFHPQSHSPVNTNSEDSFDVNDDFGDAFNNERENLDIDFDEKVLTSSAMALFPLELTAADDDDFDELEKEPEREPLEEQEEGEEEEEKAKKRPPPKELLPPSKKRGSLPPPKTKPKEPLTVTESKDDDIESVNEDTSVKERGVMKEESSKRKPGRPRKTDSAPYCVEKSPEDGLFHCPNCPKSFNQQRYLINHYRFVSGYRCQ